MTAALRTDRAEKRVHVVQAGHAISDDPAVCLTTILGSCVAACLWDPVAGVGGMNHFLLPERPEGAVGDKRYGVQAMEVLINGLLQRGARRERLQAKAFGGGRMSERMADIGARNAAFIRGFLADEGIPLVAESLGGGAARRIQFWPVGARARQHIVEDTTVADRERALARPEPRNAGGDLELF